MLNAWSLCFLEDTNDILFHLIVWVITKEKQNKHRDVIKLLPKQMAGYSYSYFMTRSGVK